MKRYPELLATLIRVIALLTRNGSSWGVTIIDLAGELVLARPEERSMVGRKLLSLYGGMGSFNDVVLQNRLGVSPDNDELDSLRSTLYQLCAELAAS
jgi:hypothetical protein